MLRVAAAGSLPIPKPTFIEIARPAGVVTATVELVLTGMSGVPPTPAQQVFAAAASPPKLAPTSTASAATSGTRRRIIRGVVSRPLKRRLSVA